MTIVPVFSIGTFLNPIDTKTATMKTFTATPSSPSRVARQTVQNFEIMRPVSRLLLGVHELFAALGKWMRLIRAYNDLQRLDNTTLRDLGYRRGELDRVLDGHRPSLDR
jgi:uncharacterized protein YjiS (DUF1127 family)